MSVISQFSSGGVKSVQSGVASAAGAVTITSVNTAKSVVYSVSKGSAGTVAATGTISAPTGSYSGAVTYGNYQQGYGGGSGGTAPESGTISLTTTTITGGTTDLTTKQYSARLTNATTLTVDGPCEWQVVEHY